MFNLIQQVARGHAKARRYPQDQSERWLTLPALQFAVVRAVDVRQQGELILSDALAHPLCADDLTKGRCCQRLERCRAPRG